MTSRIRQTGTKGFKLEGYRFDAAADNSTLLPTHERTHRIPGAVKGGFGQSNICYAYTNHGNRKAAKWIDDAVKYVLSYEKANLLTDAAAENAADEAAAVAQEQAAGFQSNPHIRKLVEEHAMRMARRTLKQLRYSHFKNTSSTKPYDYTCEKGGTRYYVEVKGTQTLGTTIILTSGEVHHVQANPNTSILVLVHSVRVRGNDSANGGTSVVKERWRLREGDLRPIQYTWATAC